MALVFLVFLFLQFCSWRSALAGVFQSATERRLICNNVGAGRVVCSVRGSCAFRSSVKRLPAMARGSCSRDCSSLAWVVFIA